MYGDVRRCHTRRRANATIYHATRVIQKDLLVFLAISEADFGGKYPIKSHIMLYNLFYIDIGTLMQ